MRLDADVAWSAGGCLHACFTLRGDLSMLRLPRRRQGRRRDGLWRSTCFELFVAAPAGERYLELNFSPSGDWAAYGFRRYRSLGSVRRPPLNPVMRVGRAGNVLTLAVAVALTPWFAPVAPRALRLGLAAVVEDARGSLSYWAAHHAAEHPDFHRSASFALRLQALPPLPSTLVRFAGRA